MSPVQYENMANEHNKDGLNLGWWLQLFASPYCTCSYAWAEINIDVMC